MDSTNENMEEVKVRKVVERFHRISSCHASMPSYVE